MLVRPWLAAALRAPGDALGIWRDAHGRPHLGAAHAGHDVNWSHSGEYLLVALGDGVRVGADLEFLRPRPRAMVLADRFFTAGESARLRDMPHDDAETAFVRLWCAKEAAAKCLGLGLQGTPEAFEVQFADAECQCAYVEHAGVPVHIDLVRESTSIIALASERSWEIQ